LFDLLKNAVCIPFLINSSLRLHCSSRPQQLFSVLWPGPEWGLLEPKHCPALVSPLFYTEPFHFICWPV